MSAPPAATIIVPAWNASETIRACLDAVAAQRDGWAHPADGTPLELIVVDDGSTDGTDTIVRDWLAEGAHSNLDARCIRTAHRGAAAARNTGASEARAPILLFTDADCRPDERWAERIMQPVIAGAADAAMGCYRSDQSAMVARITQAEYEHKERKMQTAERVTFFDTASACIRADVLRAAGGFRESMAAVEDTELAFRLHRGGHRMVLVPTAHVWHRHPTRWADYFRRKLRFGRWGARAYLEHPGRIAGDGRTGAAMRTQLVLAPLLVGSLLALPFSAGPGLWSARSLSLGGPAGVVATVGVIAWWMSAAPFVLSAVRSGVRWDVALIWPWAAFVRAVGIDIGLLAGGIEWVMGVRAPASRA